MRKSKSHTTQRQDAVKYGRVSSKEQEKEGFSIPAQFKLLDQYAKSQGLKVVREFVDVETAKKPGRAGFDEMIKFLKRSSVRVLLVEKTDRLYRNLKDYVTVDELDLEIHFVKEKSLNSALNNLNQLIWKRTKPERTKSVRSRIVFSCG